MNRRHSRLRRALVAFADGALWLTALAGALSMLAALAMLVTGTSLVLYTGGSMAPTIERCAVTLTQRIDASEVRVGDVLTVDRPGLHPVSHRVTSVSEIDGTTMRSVTMRGDANGRDDDEPYVFSTARRHLLTLPISAKSLVTVLRSPLVPGAIAAGGAFLVIVLTFRRRRKRSSTRASTSENRSDSIAG